jgi:hypothetical protein
MSGVVCVWDAPGTCKVETGIGKLIIVRNSEGLLRNYTLRNPEIRLLFLERCYQQGYATNMCSCQDTEVRFPAGTTIFVFVAAVRPAAAQPASYPMGTGGKAAGPWNWPLLRVLPKCKNHPQPHSSWCLIKNRENFSYHSYHERNFKKVKLFLVLNWAPCHEDMGKCWWSSTHF